MAFSGGQGRSAVKADFVCILARENVRRVIGVLVGLGRYSD